MHHRLRPLANAVGATLLLATLGPASLAADTAGNNNLRHATAEPAYLTAILPGQILTGTGVGLMLPSFTATAAATLRPDQLSTGIGVQTMFRQIGAALGLASWVAIVGTPAAGDAVDAFGKGWAFMSVTAVLAGLALAPMARGRLVHTLPV